MKNVKTELYKLGTSLRPLFLQSKPMHDSPTPASDAVQARVQFRLWQVRQAFWQVRDEVCS